MLDLLDSGLQRNSDDLRKRFETAEPFRHVTLDQFLDPKFCGELMGGFPGFDATRALNERGEIGRKAVRPDVADIGPAYARFDRLMRSRKFLGLMSQVTGIPNLLYDPEYVGGGTHENLDGQELDSHVDFNFHPKRHWHRRLNLIVFLNREWDASWGGCLELLRDPLAPVVENRVTVVPLANHAVLFETTERSWHGFRKIGLPADNRGWSRRSIAVYFYTKERPAEETATSHATIYFQRPLPDRIRAGYTLTEGDVEELRNLLERRDTQMKFLYDRERRFSTLISSLTQSASFRAGRALTWPARLVRGVVKGKN